jgi:hypothetical protein
MHAPIFCSSPLFRSNLLIFLAACGGEQTFSKSNPEPNVQEGKGSFSIEPAEIVWTGLDWEAGIGQSEAYVVSNTGESNLVLYKVNLSNAGALEAGNTFYVEEEEEINLASGSDREFTAVATLAEFDMAEGELRIQTNDDDNLDVRIPLFAYPDGWVEDTGDTGGGSGKGDDTGD